MRLSITDAAREVPDRIALVDGSTSYTYAALAKIVERVPERIDRCVIGAPELAAIVQTLALLERGRPIVFVHPKWVEEERRRITSAIGEVDAAAVFFTSGTTGTPKGARLSAASLVAAAEAVLERIGVREDERWLLALPIAHVGGFSILARALVSRKTIVLGGLEQLPGATITSLVPTQLKRLLDGGFNERSAPSLRAILLGGSAASVALLSSAKDAGLTIHTTYGLTETCAALAIDGLPLRGIQLELGAQGTIRVRGPTLMSGYLDSCPFDQNGWFDTGDLGQLDHVGPRDVGPREHGRLLVISRRTDLIVTGGENVSPAEVEAALEASGDVAGACVFGLPDELWGEVVCAAVVPRPGRSIDPRALAGYLARMLAPFKRPRRWAVVDALPETPQGKLDRAQARTRFAQEAGPAREL